MSLAVQIKRDIKNTNLGMKAYYAKQLSYKDPNGKEISWKKYLINNINKIDVYPLKDNKAQQYVKLLTNVKINPLKSKYFFYSIDPYSYMNYHEMIFDNYSIDYSLVVNGSFKEISSKLNDGSKYSTNELSIINALKNYCNRLRKDINVQKNYRKQIDAIESIFYRPAESLFEALQRILFVNQFLWQSGHHLNGLGHLDWLLEDLYNNDISNGNLSTSEVSELLEDFITTLHNLYWFKSSSLLGDTGQIIILGGNDINDHYHCNDLTYLFIKAVMKLRLPDPKVFLRCGKLMPDDLMELALDCISTGLGEPFLSNDEQVIPALISCGYSNEDAHNYVTSACWEPLIAGESCDQNNCYVFDYAIPLVNLLNSYEKLDEIQSINEFENIYKEYLREYIKDVISTISSYRYEEDPYLSLFSRQSLNNKKDLLKGGAKYSNLGMTSVGMGSVVNSIINIDELVFNKHEYSLNELNNIRKNNFANNDVLLSRLKNDNDVFGMDNSRVINLTKEIEACASDTLSKYNTYLGGLYKLGLSSPGYITNATDIEATLDGRRNGDPFTTHISANRSLPPTELLMFASKLDYKKNKCNGNVVDFFATPKSIKNHIKEYCTLIKAAFLKGVFQMQMNVVDSATLIAAKNDPSSFPNLIVRVWGFSAYFNDLPEEYKDVLIKRALDSEKAA